MKKFGVVVGYDERFELFIKPVTPDLCAETNEVSVIVSVVHAAL